MTPYRKQLGDQDCYLTQSQHTDTGPTIVNTGGVRPGSQQGGQKSSSVEVSGVAGPLRVGCHPTLSCLTPPRLTTWHGAGLVTGRYGDRQTWRQADMETWRQADVETGRHGDRQTWRQADMETQKLTQGQTDTQTDTGTDMETHKLTQEQIWRHTN